jgi:hypothetical protein
MIKINYQYTILFASTVAGVGTNADSTPTAVLWRNGSASGVSVMVSTTAQTGLYKAVFTTDAGWGNADFLELYVTATIAGTAGYLAKVWSSTEIGAAELDSSVGDQITGIKAKTDNLPSDPADQSIIIAATDAVMTRLGAPAGASIAADIAAIDGGGGGGGDATLENQETIISLLSTTTISVTGYARFDSNGVLQLKRGHTATLTFTSDTNNIVSDMSAETTKVFFGIKDAAGRSWLSIEGTKLVNTGLQSVRFTISAALAAAMINGEHFFDVVAVYGYNVGTTPKYTSLEPFTSGRAKVTDLYVDI